MTTEESFETRSQDVEALREKPKLLGMPLTYSVVAVALSIAMFVTIAWYVGLACGIILLSGLYLMHHKDPQALDVLIDRVRSQVRAWRAGMKSKLQILTY